MIDQNAVEAAAPAAPEVSGLLEAARQLVDCGCLDGRLSVVDQIASALSAQAEEIERLRRENAALAAWQCVYTDGKTGIVCDEHGSQSCHMTDRAVSLLAERSAAKRRIEELEAGLREYAKLSNWSYGGRFDANDGDFDGIRFAESVLRAKEGNDA